MTNEYKASVIVTDFDRSVGATSKEINFRIEIQECEDSIGGFSFDILIENAIDDGFKEVRPQTVSWQRTFGEGNDLNIVYTFEKIYENEFISAVVIGQIDVECFD